MREKLSKISIVTLAITTVLLFGFFMAATSLAFPGKGYKEKGNQEEWQKQREQNKEYRKHQENMRREDRKNYEKQRHELQKHERVQERKTLKHRKEQGADGRFGYTERSDYHKHHGYREHPYDKGRHYGHYDFKGHRYGYHGHWRSWEEWDRYARQHPHIYEHGTYYRESAHLMFRFCDPGTGSCFFFSIGK
jgi:hypothetical protein